MDGQSIVEIIGVLVVAFVVLALVPLFFVFLFVKFRGGSEEMYQTTAAIKAGKVTELLPWGAPSLGELAREWVGGSTYTTSMFGRMDQAAGRVPSTTAPSGWLLAFTLESKNTGGDGRILAVTSAHRLELKVAGGVCQAALNGAAIGSFRLGEPALLGTDGAQLGTYRQGQLAVRGREVATLDARTNSSSARAQALTPLLSNLLAERTPEDEAWTLVVAVFQLGWVGVGVG